MKTASKPDNTTTDYNEAIYDAVGRSDFTLVCSRNRAGELIEVKYDDSKLTADEKTALASYLSGKGLN